jgi:carbon storage regulator
MSKPKKRGLILSRKKGQSVLIGSDVEVTVTEIRAGVVKLHFAGPSDTVILRKELVELEEVQQ